MRYIALGIATAAVVMMGLTLRPAPHATAASDTSRVDPATMYPSVDTSKLPVAEHVDAF